MSGTDAMPDLQSILATLAQFAPPVQPAESATNGDGANTPTSVGTAPTEEQKEPSRAGQVAEKAEDPRLRPQSRSSNASPRPMIDPATITTWQEGLRCVTKIAAQNPQFANGLKRMVEDQRKNEMRWYSERQALKHAQATRSNSAAQAQSILQSLHKGGNAPTASADDSVDTQAELAEFDRKIYAAQQEMEIAMTADLKTLGVPFFGTDPQLIARNEGEKNATSLSEDQSKRSPRVTQMQLMELRRRMVQHLEDLYRD